MIKYTIYDPDYGPIETALVPNGNGTYCNVFGIKDLNWTNITGSGTFVVFSGSGTFHSIVFNTGKSNSIISIFDGLTVSGSKFARIEHGNHSSTVTQYSLVYNARMTSGMTIQTNDSDDITALYYTH